jgi:hypothetical protein
MITAREVKWLMIALVFGVANWFIMAGMREEFTARFPDVSTVVVGLVVIGLLLMVYKYRGLLNLR